MNIPDNAVDAVLAKYDGWPEEYTEERQEVIRILVRKDLEVAAPFIAAQVLRDVADAEQRDSEEFARSLGVYDENDPIPAAVLVGSLRDRADEMEAGK